FPSAPGGPILLLLQRSISSSIRDDVDDDDCLAIVPGGKRPERELAKAEFTSFNPPGTRARVGALEVFVYSTVMSVKQPLQKQPLESRTAYHVLLVHNDRALLFVDSFGS